MIDKLMAGAGKLLLIAYLAIALLVGIQKHRDDGTQAGGAVTTIIEGAFWPISLIVEAIRKR